MVRWDLFLLFVFFSCSNDQDYLICNSNNSEHCKFFEIKYPNSIKELQKLNIDAIPINAKHPIDIKDEGTCTYIILTESPCM